LLASAHCVGTAGLALCVLYKDGWNETANAPRWAVRSFMEPLFVTSSKDKQEKLQLLVVGAGELCIVWCVVCFLCPYCLSAVSLVGCVPAQRGFRQLDTSYITLDAFISMQCPRWRSFVRACSGASWTSARR